MPQSPLERLKIDGWDRMIDVNIKGVPYGIAAALPYMKEQKAGHIINVSSVAGHKVGPGFAIYAATKFAVRTLSEGVRQEVKPYNIRTTLLFAPRCLFNSTAEIRHGNQKNWFTTIQGGIHRLVYGHRAHRSLVSGKRSGAHVRRKRHLRTGCSNRMAYPSAWPDPHCHCRLRLGAARGRSD